MGIGEWDGEMGIRIREWGWAYGDRRMRMKDRDGRMGMRDGGGGMGMGNGDGGIE